MENKIRFFINNNVKTYIISFLFSFFLFFWSFKINPPNVNDYQLRFLILFLIFPILFRIDKKVILNNLKYILFIILLYLHLIIQSGDLTLRTLSSLILLCPLLIIFDYYKKFFFSNLHLINLIFLIIFLSHYLLFYVIYGNYHLNNGCTNCFDFHIFKETSHFAIAIIPSLCFLLITNKIGKFTKYSLIFIISIISLLNIGKTMIFGFILLIIFVFFLKVFILDKKKIFIVSIIFLLIAIPTFIKKDTVLGFNYQGKNLSLEVYKTSLFIAKRTLEDKPLGYGFNNYSQAFSNYINEKEHYYAYVQRLNKYDGSNNFAKIISEFGVFSIFLFYFLFSFTFNKNINKFIKFCLLVPISMQLFARGVGYFNGGFILFLFYAFMIWIDTFKSRKKLKF